MTDVINEEENTNQLPDEEQESVVIDNGQTYESTESAIIAKQEADKAKLWAQESERQAGLSAGSATTAVEARDDAIAAKEYAEEAITDENLIVVATDLQATPSNIKTVATNISNVNKVAGIESDVTTVSSNTANISAVASNSTNINAVAGNSSNINAVAGNATNINAVNANKTNIDTVAGISSDVTAVAGNATNISNVASNSSNINAVAGNATNINAVNANKTNIDTVAGIDSDVAAVASISSNVTAVAGNTTNINAVAGNATNINAVAGDIANINAVAADLININNASTYANNANIWAEGTDEQVQALGGVHSSKGWADQSSQGQVQADWAEADSTEKSYIKNKPTNLVTTDTAQTIEEPKTFTDSITQANSEVAFNSLSMKDLGLVASIIPETLRKRVFAFVDSLNQNIVEVNLIRDKSNVRATMRALNAIAGTEAILAVRADDNGATYATAPASAQNGSIVVTSASSKSSNGYIKFGNGLIIQWGRGSGVAQGGTVTFPTPFGTIGQVSLTQLSSADTAYHAYLSGITKTNFTLKRHGGTPDTFSWLAIGY